MAAKPPKPPGNFLKSLLNQHNNNNKNSHQQHNNEDEDIEACNNINKNSITETTSEVNSTENNTTTASAINANKKKSNCNCSNISIMHLFHEMKQEFPTIPDTIVAQCVNENCHQRENCIQMLRHELELNPIPAQSYPAKVLHPPNNNNNNNQQQQQQQNSINNTATTNSLQKPPLQQKPTINVQQKPPLKPIKPTRTAPLKPPTTTTQTGNKTNAIITKNTLANKPLDGENVANNEYCGGGGDGVVGDVDGIVKQVGELEIDGGGGVELSKQSITTPTNINSNTPTTAEVNNNCNSIGINNEENIERNLPRQRPTTLNLNSQIQKQQQLQRQRLNVQLQQRFQEQRNRQQQQQQTQSPTQTQNHINITKPLRKAPLPPIAPKPSQFHNNNLTNTTKSNFFNDSLSSNNSTTSPLSESEISVSVSLSTPSPTSPNQPTTHHNTHLPTKSPIRHRSVITLQPEPPYTRDFLYASGSSTPTSPSLTAPPTTAIQTTSSSSANSSPTASIAGSQKSFTSVNLTLRPPISPTGPNSALQPSTIDITAGPGFSGASGGGKSLHYSSTSYDARLGYQQNFQITVTDEGGVFSACRIRPQPKQRSLNQVNIRKENQYDDNNFANHNNYINSFLNAEKQHYHHQQQQQQQQQQFHNNNVVALQQNIQNSIQSPNGIGGVNTSSGFGGSGGFNCGAGVGSGGVGGGNTITNISGNMCIPPQQQQAMDERTQEILQRQKKKRDKLAAALREYKKRLGNVEQEINLLTGTIPIEGLSERLDVEIQKLRRDCQDMVRNSSTFSQPPTQQELAINYQPNQQQQQAQPFPRPRLTRPPPRPPPPRQTSLDIIQHHSQSSTPHTPPAASLPNLYNSPTQQQHNSHINSMTSPSYYHQQSEPLRSNNHSMHDMYSSDSAYNDDEEPLVDDVDDYEDEYEEVVEPWECNMCTFRNHPQLNICETCENVRILPGRLSNIPRALSANNCTNLSGGLAPTTSTSAAGTPNLSLLRANSGSSTALNHSNSSSRNGLNTALTNGNLEHDNCFALHT